MIQKEVMTRKEHFVEEITSNISSTPTPRKAENRDATFNHNQTTEEINKELARALVDEDDGGDAKDGEHSPPNR